MTWYDEEQELERPFVGSGETYFQGGWVRYYDEVHPEPVWVRVQPTPEGRLIIRELYLNADNDLGSERIDSDQLRRLSPARIEARLNGPASKALILERLGQAPGPKEPRGPAKPSPMIRGEVSYSVIGGGLHPPPGRPRPDSFYQDVAKEYLHAASVNARPAVVLAAGAEVPVSTMHGWIKEARRRGFLPPGQKGRRG
jgi:hypothetical protein